MARLINHEEFIGQKIGKVTILSFSHSTPTEKEGRLYYYYTYLCECGNVGVAAKHTLLQSLKKNTYSCKSCRGINLGLRNTITSVKYENPLEAKCAILFSNYKSKCKSKGWDFELTFEQFKNIVTQNCHYCNLEPNNCRLDRAKSRQGISRINFNGIDRKDNSLYYTVENSLPCCEDCNKAKRELSYDDFIVLIKRIYEYRFSN